MHESFAKAKGALITAALCAGCWWLWSADHGLSRIVGLEALDIPVRLLAIFVVLSIVDTLLEWFGQSESHT